MYGNEKFKVALSQNPHQEVLGACLRMASFSKKIDTQTLKLALEKVKVKQISQWQEKNIPPGLAKLRKLVMKKQLKKCVPKVA
ncbi:MAG: hypothetical protein KDE26_02570 [Bacteroidetes bacterium]|nr:hypothetical protein [Bacteroidota bacterium]